MKPQREPKQTAKTSLVDKLRSGGPEAFTKEELQQLQTAFEDVTRTNLELRRLNSAMGLALYRKRLQLTCEEHADGSVRTGKFRKRASGERRRRIVGWVGQPSDQRRRLGAEHFRADPVVFDVRLPPGAGIGPVIDRAALRAAGRVSSPAFRIGVAVPTVTWIPGVTRPPMRGVGGVWTGDGEPLSGALRTGPAADRLRAGRCAKAVPCG